MTLHDEAMEPTNGEKGFTLVELMVVIAIISLFAAVAIPVIRGYRATRGRDLGDAALILYSTLKTARTYAIQYRVPTRVLFERPPGHVEGPPDRYLIARHYKNPVTGDVEWVPAPGIVGKKHKVPENVTIEFPDTQPPYEFDPTGTLDTPSALKVTVMLRDEDGEVSPRRIEILRATGQVRIRSTVEWEM
jgi:prepilin-type N-terminal cleavage/methylation domain-containing protein